MLTLPQRQLPRSPALQQVPAPRAARQQDVTGPRPRAPPRQSPADAETGSALRAAKPRPQRFDPVSARQAASPFQTPAKFGTGLWWKTCIAISRQDCLQGRFCFWCCRSTATYMTSLGRVAEAAAACRMCSSAGRQRCWRCAMRGTTRAWCARLRRPAARSARVCPPATRAAAWRQPRPRSPRAATPACCTSRASWLVRTALWQAEACGVAAFPRADPTSGSVEQGALMRQVAGAAPHPDQHWRDVS